MFGLKPDPAGHNALNSSVSGAGQSSHCGPQALPTEQQHVDRETGSPSSLLQTFRPAGVCWTPRKHDPTRLSVQVRWIIYISIRKVSKEFIYRRIRFARGSVRDAVDTDRRSYPVNWCNFRTDTLVGSRIHRYQYNFRPIHQEWSLCHKYSGTFRKCFRICRTRKDYWTFDIRQYLKNK